MKTEIAVGTRVYYSGDMANQSGWFTVGAVRTDTGTRYYELVESNEDFSQGRVFAGVMGIGHEYKGHCNPRFVTERAYRRFYEAKAA